MSTEFASMKHDKASIAQLQMVQEEALDPAEAVGVS